MPRSRILGTGRYVPSTVVTNAELCERLNTSDAWIREHTGIERRHVLAPGELTSDMAAAAARSAIEAAKLSVADLDMIIVATTSGDSPMPATAVYVQQKLGADVIPSFDLAASFAGFLFALTVADQFIATEKYKTILVVGADAMSRRVDPNDRTTAPLFGDGAGAVVLGPASGDTRGLLSSRIHSDGTLASLLTIPGGGTAAPMTKETLSKGTEHITMEGRELFQITVKHLAAYSMRALKAAGLTSAELDWVVPQQANTKIIDGISARLGFARSKFIENVAEYANTSAASIPIALDEAVRDGRITKGQTVLLCSLGGGASWGASIVRM